ncbi:hypothetical protein IJ095_00795 [Candidatus Saccharibacteria bacterium]|nr:hypothetical protein [Candidatus Saccharibacteria bacterium]
MSAKLTKKQKQIVDFISAFVEEHNYSPSYREIMSGLGLSSVSAVAEHIDNLVEKGALKKTPGTARSLEVVDLSFPETTALFQLKLKSASEEDAGTLLRAAELLGLDLGA